MSLSKLPLRIYYDGIIYGDYSERPGGITNFFDHLISDVSNQHICLLTSARSLNKPHPRGTNLKISHFNLNIYPSKINKILCRAHSAAASAKFRPDLLHPTYYVMPSIFHSNLPLVYTVYDMIHEKWPQDLDPTGKAAIQKYRSLKHANAIVCISNSTCKDLLTLYPELEPKTSVIYLAGQPKHLPCMKVKAPYQYNHRPYFLFVGARKSYKNFIRLAQAFKLISKRSEDLRLKVVGASFDASEQEFLSSLSILHRVDLYTSVSDIELYELYKNSLAFIYPSLYEGFGIPPLEAMALGTPVLASNTSSIPEVVGPAALLFNPWSIDSIFEAMVRIVKCPELRDDLIAKGKKQSARFSWAKTSADYMDLYQTLAR